MSLDIIILREVLLSSKRVRERILLINTIRHIFVNIFFTGHSCWPDLGVIKDNSIDSSIVIRYLPKHHMTTI